jgi:hypothetical protein
VEPEDDILHQLEQQLEFYDPVTVLSTADMQTQPPLDEESQLLQFSNQFSSYHAASEIDVDSAAQLLGIPTVQIENEGQMPLAIEEPQLHRELETVQEELPSFQTFRESPPSEFASMDLQEQGSNSLMDHSPSYPPVVDIAMPEEPLFDQFDELEEFLTDLAGELGVYEETL